jgi:hypothetical protein
VTGRLDRIGAPVFPALATVWQAARAPAQRSSLVVEARWSYSLRLRFPLLPLRGRPLGPRLSGVLWSLRPGGHIRFAFVSRSWLRAARAPAPQEWLRHRDQVGPYLRSLWFPALGNRPFGPRLRKRHRRHRPDRDAVAGRYFPRSWLRATSGHGSAEWPRRHRPDRASFSEPPIFPLSPLRGGPLGPRLRKRHSRHRPDRASFSEPPSQPRSR